MMICMPMAFPALFMFFYYRLSVAEESCFWNSSLLGCDVVVLQYDTSVLEDLAASVLTLKKQAARSSETLVSHGITTQKTLIWILNAVKTSNLICFSKWTFMCLYTMYHISMWTQPSEVTPTEKYSFMERKFVSIRQSYSKQVL